MPDSPVGGARLCEEALVSEELPAAGERLRRDGLRESR